MHKTWRIMREHLHRRQYGVLVILTMLAGNMAVASTETSGGRNHVCDLAAQVAADATSVPLDVLRAVTRTETGRLRNGVLEPWPWTTNLEGKGQWFASRDAALSNAFEHYKAGARSFDVGCFQINYKWHHTAFSSLDAMFDPVENATYAARFLLDLHAEFGDWDSAVGAYHSRTDAFATRYLARYQRIHATMGAAGDLQAAPTVQSVFARVEAFTPGAPRRAGKPAALGSLMAGRSTADTPMFSMAARPAITQ